MSLQSRAVLIAAAFVSAFLSRGSLAAQPPSVQQINDEFVARIRAQIAGHEREPAGQVFKNVQFLKATQASTFLVIMNIGYSKGSASRARIATMRRTSRATRNGRRRPRARCRRCIAA